LNAIVKAVDLGNKISDDGAKVIAEALKTNKSVTTIDFGSETHTHTHTYTLSVAENGEFR
jgi:hypothetical protein